MKIAISGLSGCGNTTASKLVGEKLGLKVINYTFKDLSRELGIDFDQLHDKAEQDEKIDLMLDKKLIEESQQDCVLASRLACWLINADLKVWLHASLRTRATRIAERDGIALEEALKKTSGRDKKNIGRYKKYYGVNLKKFVEVADLVINNEGYAPEQVASLIAEAAKNPPKPNRKVRKFAKKIAALVKEKLG